MKTRQIAIIACAIVVYVSLPSLADEPVVNPRRGGLQENPASNAKSRDEARPADFRQALLKRFDENGNGRLDPAEMAKARAAAPQLGGGAPNARSSAQGGLGDLSREAIMKRFDANNNGKLEPAELAKARQAMQAQGVSADRESLMKRFDANGDGRIDDSEREKAREAFQKMRGAGGNFAGGNFNPQPGQPDRIARLNNSALLERFDANHNGKLDPEERQAATAELRKIRQD